MSCRCGHLSAMHIAGGTCRLNGCGCQEFRDADASDVPEQGKARTITVEVPDGYMLSISLIPYTPEAVAAEEATDGS